MSEIVSQVSFMLGIPANENIEELSIETAVSIAFRELKRYIKTPVDKTVPYSVRVDLVKLGIKATTILSVFAANPRMGMSLGSIESGNVFQVAAAVGTSNAMGNTTRLNLEPIITEMALAQVRNTLSTDFQWTWDRHNECIYIPHRAPIPAAVTIRYVPDYQDVSEIQGPTWLDYLIRMSEANMKKALGRSRSKYTVEGSNVSNDGTQLLDEANTELETIRAELEARKSKIVILN
jgi:hypothetical protein